MKKIFFILIVLLWVSNCVIGQDKSDDLKKLFEVMDAEKTMSEMMDNIKPILKKQAELEFKNDEDKLNYSKYLDYILGEVERISTRMLNEDMYALYDKHFTQEEIKYLIQFYESPTGKKFIEKTPQITKELMETMMQKYMPAFQNNMINKLGELKKE